MSITTTAAARVLDNFAGQLAQAADAKPAADAFLAELGKHFDTTTPVYAYHRELHELPGVGQAWDAMHAAVRGAIDGIDTPRFGTAGVHEARTLVGRLKQAEAGMRSVEMNNAMPTDVARIAYSVRSRIDDITGRARAAVAAEADTLRSIERSSGIGFG